MHRLRNETTASSLSVTRTEPSTHIPLCDENSQQGNALDDECTSIKSIPASDMSLTRGLSSLDYGSESKHLLPRSSFESSCRFPRLEDCAHFHYALVQLGSLSVHLVSGKTEQQGSILSQTLSTDCTTPETLNTPLTANRRICFIQEGLSYLIKVCPRDCDPFLIKRSFENFQMLDEMLHRCVYDRKISRLCNLKDMNVSNEEDLEREVANYLNAFSKIASDSLTCATILAWFQLDNKGRRLPFADSESQRTINTPAVGAAYGVRRYQAQASDEISIDVGDMISVIDMPSPAESVWWRGKKSHSIKTQYEVGFFPQSCVAIIGEKVPRNFPLPAPLVGQVEISPTKPVLRKHGKLIAFFRSFILSRPPRRHLKQSGIYRERVFACDLSEHLLNSGHDIPMVLRSCAEFIENYGIIDGIYRLSGITSNIQRLRSAFDEERLPDLGNPEMKQDIHAVSSLLKMYFRELPNPLCTYQLYDDFVESIQTGTGPTERLKLMKDTVYKLPPPHYRTLKYLAQHLNKVSNHHHRTGMTDKNLAIVWAPNLLRSPTLESGGVAALRGVGVQAVVTEYLIRNCDLIFDPSIDMSSRSSLPCSTFGQQNQADSSTECGSLSIDQQYDSSLPMERPKSLGGNGGHKLISLEEAQERKWRVENSYARQEAHHIHIVANNAPSIGSYIEVGGGPSSLPDKYHTVLAVPRSWQKRKTHSWKSLFTRSQRVSQNDGLRSFEKPSQTSKIEVTEGDAQVQFACKTAATAPKRAQNELLTKNNKSKCSAVFDVIGVMGPQKSLCARASSVDSLRTIGHSRSVSHDSYFDMLQSPQRGYVTPSCVSRELSELGLNFDREESEMRFFSESESLVSSPHVGKENVPPVLDPLCRKFLRARPEEFSSQGNSVNPSPKKQPRLNLSLPSSELIELKGKQINSEILSGSEIESLNRMRNLEKEISSIEFIDCGTPEQMNTDSQAVSIRLHEELEHQNANARVRYSYPSTHLANRRKDKIIGDHSNPMGRYSYPAIPLRVNDLTNDLKCSSLQCASNANWSLTNVKCDKLTGRDICLQSTPRGRACSPMRSPRYSLLSSYNSSLVNTPQLEQEPLLAPLEDSVALLKQNVIDVCITSEVKSFTTSHRKKSAAVDISNTATIRKVQAKKQELTLDFNVADTQRVDVSSLDISMPTKLHMPSPSKSNYTDNTSQSVTPSEYGYHHLQHQSSVRSLVDTETSSSSEEKLLISSETSPMEATPIAKIHFESSNADDRLLLLGQEETPCNDIIYDRVKQFQNSISEVNKMLVSVRNNTRDSRNDAMQAPNNPAKSPTYENLISENDDHFCKNIDIGLSRDLYENISGEVMKAKPIGKSSAKNLKLSPDKKCIPKSKPPSSLSVKALATKFESFPLKNTSPLDQSSNSSLATHKCKTSSTSSCVIESTTENLNPKRNEETLNKSQQLTRSLDESAFKREFGRRCSVDNRASHNYSLNTLQFTENKNRRKSVDTMTPKTLNLPKTLPHMPISENVCINKCQRANERFAVKTPSDMSTEEFSVITPTTEHQVALQQGARQLPHSKQHSNSNEYSGSNLNVKDVLSSVKLDRERIDRYKKERRQQLNEKYNAELLKSRSRTELNSDLRDDESKCVQSLRVKSKSRGDVNLSQDLGDNQKHFSLTLHNVNSHSLRDNNPCAWYNRSSTSKNCFCENLIEKTQNFGTGRRFELLSDTNTPIVNPTLIKQYTTSQQTMRQCSQLNHHSFKPDQWNNQKFDLATKCKEHKTQFITEHNKSVNTPKGEITPTFSIKDVAAMFESQSK